MAEGKEDKVPSEEGAPSEAEVQKFLGWVDRRDETVRPFEDEETDILAAVYERLRRLDPGAQSRILDYMRDRLAADARKSATED